MSKIWVHNFLTLHAGHAGHHIVLVGHLVAVRVPRLRLHLRLDRGLCRPLLRRTQVAGKIVIAQCLTIVLNVHVENVSLIFYR